MRVAISPIRANRVSYDSSYWAFSFKKKTIVRGFDSAAITSRETSRAEIPYTGRIRCVWSPARLILRLTEPFDQPPWRPRPRDPLRVTKPRPEQLYDTKGPAEHDTNRSLGADSETEPDLREVFRQKFHPIVSRVFYYTKPDPTHGPGLVSGFLRGIWSALIHSGLHH